jgi:SAM-dependent methyltransferase
MRSFDELIAEAVAAPVTGWDFSWLDGRATEARPSWGYARLAAERMTAATTALDVATGGGEILAGLNRRAPAMVATESWWPNVPIAARNLRPCGAWVVPADEAMQSLPFRSEVFDLVISRHPVDAWWAEIARVLRPGGTYLSQEIGADSNAALYEAIVGPVPPGEKRSPERSAEAAADAGLTVVDLRCESLPVVFYDIGAVVWFLRKVIWTIPGFSADQYLTELFALHQRIRAQGSFVSKAERFLIEARKLA